MEKPINTSQSSLLSILDTFHYKGENHEESYLVVDLTKKATSNNFNNKSFKKLHDFAPVGIPLKTSEKLQFGWVDTIHYIESWLCIMMFCSKRSA
ncbi:hypothetical protein ACOSP7_027065 [Xanthoceras sorbifolium]